MIDVSDGGWENSYVNGFVREVFEIDVPPNPQTFSRKGVLAFLERA